MQVSQRNVMSSELDTNPQAAQKSTVGRRGFIKGVSAGLGLGVLALGTIGASPAAAATHAQHCNRNVTYIKMRGCWCVSPDYFCSYAKYCSICLGQCGQFTEITGCC